MAIDFSSFSNSTSNDLFLFGPTDGWFGIGQDAVIQQLKRLGNEPLTIHISSPGGSVEDALAIYDYLKGYPGRKTARLSGLVASAATFIAMAADEIEISSNCIFMIHNLSGTISGEANTLRKQADIMDKLTERIISIYAERTGLSATKIYEMMNQESWLNAVEAKTWGFADRIIEGVRIAAEISFRQISELRHTTNKTNMENKNMNISNEIKTQVEAGFSGLREWLSGVFHKEENTIENRVKEFEERIANATSNIREEVTAKFENVVSELRASEEKLKGENTKLQEELLRVKASGETAKLENPAEGEPANFQPMIKTDPFVNVLAGEILDLMSPSERERLR